MAAKSILISADDITYNLLPGSQGQISREGAVIEDTIFGQTYKSGLTGPIGWSINANAVYKGFAGYQATLKKPGTSTNSAAEACTLVSGKTYQINAATHRILDRAFATVVKDNGVNHNVDVASIDYLFGTVTFNTSYTVTTPVTMDVHYFPTVDLAKFRGFTLNQTAEAILDSDIPTLLANGGYHTHRPGLKTVTIDVPTVYNSVDAWDVALSTRGEYIIEINPDGTGLSGSVARGFFRLLSQAQQGNVGALEEETLKFTLNVPLTNTLTPTFPFEWVHNVNSPMPLAIQKALTGWATDVNVYGKYLHNGVAGWKGQGVVTNITLTDAMDSAILFAATLNMSGAPTII